MDARVSATSSPARRSAASSSGRESGLRPGAAKASRTSADQRLEQPRPGAARRPRPEQVGEQALVDVDAPRHARRASSRPRRGRPTTRPRAAARAGRPRARPPRRPAAGRPRGRRAGARPCRRPRTAPGRTARSARAGPSAPTARPSSSRASTAGARRSRWWPSRRSWQRSTRTPAASSGGYHRAVSSHTQRGASASRAAHVRRQVGQRHLALAPSPSTTSTRSPGRRESETRVTGTP